MATPLMEVYEAFLAKMATDEWDEDTATEIMQSDWYQILLAAIFRFRYPRISLEIDGADFVETLTNDEIQMLAWLMKSEWLRRFLLKWSNIKMLYTDKDFSQANYLDKLKQINEQVTAECERLEGFYYRTERHKPSSLYSKLAGKKK